MSKKNKKREVVKKDLIKKWNEHKILYTCILLFLVAFCYIMFFTNYIPFFWDDHQFHQSYFKKSFSDIGSEFFSLGSESPGASSRAVYELFFKTLFFFGGYNIVLFRTAKALVFAFLIVALFYFSQRYLKNYTLSLLFSLFIMASFPLYIQTLVYDEPYIIAELFKVLAFYLFFKDFHAKKTSVKTQFSIAFLGLLAIRTYQPAYAIPLIFGLFILFSKFKNFKRYFLLIGFLFATNFPFSSIFSLSVESLGPHPWNLLQTKRFLFNNAAEYIFSPFVSLQHLYYKPLVSIITFFGFWLITVTIIIYLLRKKLIAAYPKYFVRKTTTNKSASTKSYSIPSYGSLALFLCAWIIGEIPLWFALPEHAVRYVIPVLIPLMLLFFILIQKTLLLFKQDYRKIALFIVIATVALAILTNIAYTAVFRAGWGSSFAGMEKVTHYIESERQENAVILYFSHSVAFEYIPMVIEKGSKGSSGKYELIKKGVKYKQISSLDELSPEYLSRFSANYSEVYVIKRVTSFAKNELPPIDFDSYESLALQTVIKGDTPSLFDTLITLVKKPLGYEPQNFFVYKYKNITEST